MKLSIIRKKTNHNHPTIKCCSIFFFVVIYIFANHYVTFFVSYSIFFSFILADDEDAGLRRISYIKATKEDRIQAGIDSDDFEDEIILGIEHDYDINNSSEYNQSASSQQQHQPHKHHKRYSFKFWQLQIKMIFL